MKITHLLFKPLLALMIIGVSLSSCSSDDDSNSSNSGKSSYSINIEGDKTYSNSWDGESEEGAIVSLFNKNIEGAQNISLVLTDDLNDFNLLGAFMLNSAQQPLPLGNLTNEDMGNGDHSSIIISVGDKNYISSSGSAKISNLKISMLGELTGFASYDMAIDGMFEASETKAAVKITGTVKVMSYF